jgi:hypothetical protein
MEIGRDWDAEWKNQWPLEKEIPLFKKRILDFYQVGFIVSSEGGHENNAFFIICNRRVITFT